MNETGVTIRWHGQACITVASPGGVTVMIDPFDESIGYRLPPIAPDVVVTTHRHYDHSNVAGVRGRPKVIQGLTDDGAWATIDEMVGDVHLASVGAYHDEVRGAKRGRTSLILLETAELRILHCGDLGHVLEPEQVRAIGAIDILIIPVGGVYTVHAEEAREVVRQLAPRLAVIPIHYQTPQLSLRLDPVDGFLRCWKRIHRMESNEVFFSKYTPRAGSEGPESVVLSSQPME